jgi:Divergent InlB B-repeat domain
MRNRQLLPLAAGVLVALGLLAATPAPSSASCTHPYCPSYRLKVNKGGDGSGKVTSSPAGINCGATCEASYEEGTKVTLTANAASGSTFTKWAGGGCSGSGKCTVTIEHNTTVTAVFHRNAPPRPHVHVRATPHGTAHCTVFLPQPGKIKIWGPSVRAAYIKAGKGGKFKVVLRPKGRVAQHLRNRGWTRRKRIFVIYTQGSTRTKVKSVVRFRNKRHGG